MHPPVQEVQTAQIIVLAAAILVVAFRRTVARWLLTLALLAIIVTLGFGLIMIWQMVQQMVR